MFKMIKKSKLSTPEWILKGYDSLESYEKTKIKSSKKNEKKYKIRKCPECKSGNVVVMIGEENIGKWKCKNCNWKGKNILIEELNEDEFLNYLDKKGEL
jgi:Zn ribbon nucleic-acid-binding protein